MKKNFLENNGLFIIQIPVEWGYKNPEFDAKENEPHSFELYEKSIGCFQITCKPKTTGKIRELIKSKKLKTQEIGKTNLEFQENFAPSEKFDVYFWMAIVEDYFIMCKYIYDAPKRKIAEIKAEIVHDYSILKDKISTILEKLEQKQFEDKIGIYGLQHPADTDTPMDEFTQKRIVALIKDKHAHKVINKNVTLK